MFYEIQNSLECEPLKMETGKDFNFPPHFHSNFELVVATKGELLVAADHFEQLLRKGEAALIFPNQLHRLTTPDRSAHVLFIFSPKLVQGFSNVFLNQLPTDNRFRPTPLFIEQLTEMAENFDMLKTKGLLYCICSEFHKNATYTEKDREKSDLLHRIFTFVERNYKNDCSLEALASHTAYHSTYISRYFKQFTGVSFTDYVNQYRITEAGYLLRNSNTKILDVALDSGFDSLRSFNRNFKAIMGMTPKQYRQSGQKRSP